MNSLEIFDAVTGLVRPDARPATPTDRATASAAVHDAMAGGSLPAQEGGHRLTAVERVRTRGQLRHALRGIDGGVPPVALTSALGIASTVWLLSTVVQVCVWLVIAFATGGPDGPWWLYSTLGGGAIVAGLWAVKESYHRRPGERVSPGSADISRSAAR